MSTTVLADTLPAVFNPVIIDGKPVHQPPEQTHPANISLDRFGEVPSRKQASQHLKLTHDGLAKLDMLRVTPNPEDTPATHFRKLRDQVKGFLDANAKSGDAAMAALKSAICDVETKLASAANLKPNPTYASAIIGTFQGFSDAQRSQAIDRLIKAKDGSTLAVLLEASPVLTGLSDAQLDFIKPRLFDAVDPESHALLKQLRSDLGRLDQAFYATLRASEKLLEGTDRFDAKVKQAEQVSRGFAA